MRKPFISLILAVAAGMSTGAEAATLELRRDDRVCLIGNGFAERFRFHGYFESGLLAAFPDLGLSMRNLAWSGDGASTSLRPERFGSIEDHLEEQDADVVLMFYGANESFPGEGGLAALRRDLAGLLRTVAGTTYSDTEPRVALVSPIPQQALPDGLGLDADAVTLRNAELRSFSEAASSVAAEVGVPFLDIFEEVATAFSEAASPLTNNGVHLNEAGYRRVARILVARLGGPDPETIELSMQGETTLSFSPPVLVRAPSDTEVALRVVVSDVLSGDYVLQRGDETLASADGADWAAGVSLPPAVTAALVETGHELRNAVLRKSRLFFDRYRAMNGKYIYGNRRSNTFGRGLFANEMAQFDTLIEQLDTKVAGLSVPAETWRLVAPAPPPDSQPPDDKGGDGGNPGGGNPGAGGGGNPGAGGGGNPGAGGGGDDRTDTDDTDDDGAERGPPSAAISTDADCPNALCRTRTGTPVRFEDASTGAVTTRLWDFGAGEPSRSSTVDRSWPAPGFYEVTLLVSNGEVESIASLTFLVEAAEPAGSCAPDAHTRCLQDGRYAATVDWRTDGGKSGHGTVVRSGTNDSGLFQFFDADNWEILIKVLDGCALNGHVWVFGASTTDLGYAIRVTDTATGAVREYTNEPGMPAAAITDTKAFPDGCRP